ncbi:hypothetical protein [Saccharibacillus sp. JS10]|nr:hypothetical protein [Saccharibacillus sp. JS10]MCQ4087028.1 hypothetical protein [Saccharibacillus sp. JS10]
MGNETLLRNEGTSFQSKVIRSGRHAKRSMNPVRNVAPNPPLYNFP